jgi:hypothetical protein
LDISLELDAYPSESILSSLTQNGRVYNSRCNHQFLRRPTRSMVYDCHSQTLNIRRISHTTQVFDQYKAKDSVWKCDLVIK